ncbi:hypothetical protein BJ878DRAFT_313210 [Calycina marina]|uniref:Uncharacterized protein n=1 Tax=Calycina marina TaxID=1763456 RepID=A0A9P7YUT6_9HELO|nr:hypothetical protein BJ878DRAFT_313210 [Calycina marina]
MSTIEPCLIALLNDDDAYYDIYKTNQPAKTVPTLELPPIQDPSILKASGHPLLLEPGASIRDGDLPPANLEDDVNNKKSFETSTRALGNSSPQSLRKILDNGSPAPSQKRKLVESNKDEFVQLPQPPKKHKAAKQVVPPIINGLFQPPPQTTLFPPIASSAFHDSHGRNSLNTVQLPLAPKEAKEANVPESTVSSENKKRSTNKRRNKTLAKARNKWTEEETNNLLLGVHKHGVGRWSDILDDVEFSFNERSGVDLKDRFRTCCPNELRQNRKSSSPSTTAPPRASKSKSSLLSENILIDEHTFGSQGTANDDNGTAKGRKLRAHRKNVEDLAHLGIEGPFKKSLRRERRPFTEEDDREILAGYELYGAAWTRIRRDTRFHLQSRQATDLRDRFRNKYSEKLRTEGDKKDARGTDTKGNIPIAQSSASGLQQSSSREGLRIHEMISEDKTKSHNSQPQSSHLSYKENFTFNEQPMEQVDRLPPFDWVASAPFSNTIGEMDISRLLLEEPWMDPTPNREKQPFTGINSLLVSSEDSPPATSYYNMLVSEEPLGMASSVPLDNENLSAEPMTWRSGDF